MSRNFRRVIQKFTEGFPIKIVVIFAKRCFQSFLTFNFSKIPCYVLLFAGLYAIQTSILAVGKFDIVILSNKIQYCHSNCFESTCKVQSVKTVWLEN